MNWKATVNEGTIGITLLATIAALIAVVIVSGPAAVAATGLRDLALLLGGALAGTKIPRKP